MRIAGLIMAAGSGDRLGLPKQFLALTENERLIDRAVATTSAVVDWVGLVLPAHHEWEGRPVDGRCTGGTSRHESLAAGLAMVPAEIEIVLVHSASHPLATVELAQLLIATVEAGADGAVPFLPTVDVIKRRDEASHLSTVGRADLGTAQCPMAFKRTALIEAFEQSASAIEESGLVEANGGTIKAVPGEASNIHVTEPVTLAMVRALAEAEIDPSDPSTLGAL